MAVETPLTSEVELALALCWFTVPGVPAGFCSSELEHATTERSEAAKRMEQAKRFMVPPIRESTL
jgi:hypothetical protein